jgi:hypothetical protein
MMKQLPSKALTCLLGALTLFGCQHHKEQHNPWVAPKATQTINPASTAPEKELLQKVESIAILPFVDHTSPGKHTLSHDDMLLFGEQFASHLTGSSTFKEVMFPLSALNQLQQTELNHLKSDDLKEIGNLLDVDAIVFGVIHHYHMYYPPRMSLSMKFYLTRAQRFASSVDISALAHTGVPLHHYNPTFFRQLWDKSSYYDGASHRVRDMIAHFGKTHHDEIYGFEAQRLLRTKKDFLNLIAYDLANSLDQSSIKEDMSTIPAQKKGKKKASLASGYYHR